MCEKNFRSQNNVLLTYEIDLKPIFKPVGQMKDKSDLKPIF